MKKLSLYKCHPGPHFNEKEKNIVMVDLSPAFKKSFEIKRTLTFRNI